MQNMDLSKEEFLGIIKRTPLVSVDLIIRNDKNQVLLGLRENQPAKGFWFVPGGRILKDERISAAFLRILEAETGIHALFSGAKFLGVFEHLYEENIFNEVGVSTHYVVLAYELVLKAPVELISDPQHSEFSWFDVSDLLGNDAVHENAKAYFTI